ncbi:hypothetical protein GW17_00052651 [Ensete ventricosum]|nr:hypothetical protein GW17_00052651 [Ensete ventricosum]
MSSGKHRQRQRRAATTTESSGDNDREQRQRRVAGSDSSEWRRNRDSRVGFDIGILNLQLGREGGNYFQAGFAIPYHTAQ